mgnify:CR=1 FL=1|jgi:hypothetical protein
MNQKTAQIYIPEKSGNKKPGTGPGFIDFRESVTILLLSPVLRKP